MRHIKLLVLGLLLAMSFAASPGFGDTTAPVGDPLYDAPGFDPNRETFCTMPNEHIDPFTGGLILSHVDAKLPGNGGLDLVIQRTFNSKNTCSEYTGFTSWWCSDFSSKDNWVGYGWTLHFGRVLNGNSNNPVIEMSDGSLHTAYLVPSSSVRTWITKDYWILTKIGNNSVFVLTLTDGKKITFGQTGTMYNAHFTGDYASQIEDANGNTILIYYTGPSATNIDHIVDSVGRTINFTSGFVNGETVNKKLLNITGPGIDITYKHDPMVHNPTSTFLTQVTPPVGSPWKYSYSDTLMDLASMTTPSGGVVNYTFDMSILNTTSYAVTYRTVVQKTTSGPGVTGGTWNFAYSQGTNHDYTQVNDPNGRVIKYTFFSYGKPLPSGSLWEYGLPKTKETVNEETLTYTYGPSKSISHDDYIIAGLGRDSDIFVPQMNQSTNKRDGKVYTTSYSKYDAYGNPQTISESGDKKRTTNIQYWYSNAAKNIVHDKRLTETITGDFQGSFTTNYTHDDNGNTKSIQKYGPSGATTKFDYYGNGNLQCRTDANLH
ncbi:MAG: DUF6531 domain-containing protein, partial [Nitrososphaeria archaeon]